MAAADGVRTTCPYCGTGCGVQVRVEGGAPVVAGDPTHPANLGRLCVKGSALGDTLDSGERLLQPQLRSRAYAPTRPVSWSRALDEVAGRFRRVIDEHGPEAVAWYVSGQLLTEDYYVANKLVKGYVGSANIDTNSRLCMSSAVAGHKRAFGEDIVPVRYDDLDHADLIVLVGSNTAWCHPILYQRIMRARERRPQMRLVVIDPRRTATAESADLHLPLRPGTDVTLFNGLLVHLHAAGCVDADFVRDHTQGATEALATAHRHGGGDAAAVARACGLSREALDTFFKWFAACSRTITAFSMGVNQSSAGTDKVNAIINCHLLTGRIGRSGAGPFSLTGQPNAMGGREVGGLANMLAAHLSLEDPQHRALVQGFWNSPRIAEQPGLQAVSLFEAIADRRVRAVWIMATNPVVSLPDGDRVRKALSRCETVVVSDVTARTDTAPYAHVLLPAQAWGEKDGTVTNSERCISRQRPFLAASGEARPDWWALCEVARRWGYGAHFAYTGAHQIFDEHARLTATGNTPPLAGTPDVPQVPRLLHLGGLAGLGQPQYDALAPVRWPVLPADATAAPARHGYPPDGRARLVPVAPRGPAGVLSRRYPLSLNTGRLRDQWHTMTRTGLAPRLLAHTGEPFIDVHPDDARDAQVRDGELVRLRSSRGRLVARLRSSGAMRRGEVFAPIHWNAQYAAAARVGALVAPVVDPLSGEPEFKYTPVRLEPFRTSWQGVALSRRPLDPRGLDWWVRVPGVSFQRYELAGVRPLETPGVWARQWLGVDEEADWIEYRDDTAGDYRAVWWVGDHVEACLFLTRGVSLPARAWLASCFDRDREEGVPPMALLAGAAPRGEDAGPTVCACYGVGRNTLVKAIRTQGLRDTAAVTACLKAGGNCGSCLPEIRSLIAECGVSPATPSAVPGPVSAA